MKKLVLLSIFVIFSKIIFAQAAFVNPVQSTSAELREKSFTQRQQLKEKSVFNEIPFKSIGPTVQGGRVVDIDVDPNDASHFYVAYATGGLFETKSNGAHFTPIFENESVITVGDIAVNYKTNTIWLGSGEVNASRSSYAGDGIYKSSDNGAHWQNMGLSETQHIGRVVLHPTDSNTVWVAALGHLYSPNKERGVFKTSDGGKTWKQTLFVDENTGAVDLVCDKNNPNILYAALWNRVRRAWNFEGNGKSSGIYKSVDGGETWNLMSTEKSGFPQGVGIGRIGLALAYLPNNKTLLYCTLDNQTEKPKTDKKDEPILTKEKLKTLSKEDFLKLDKKEVSSFLKKNGFTNTSDEIFEKLKSDSISVSTLHDFVDNGDDGFSNQAIVQAEVFSSSDEGTSFQRTHKTDLKDLFSTYGYYFATLQVDPNHPEKIYLIGTRLIKSDDSGKTWKNITGDNVHWDGHVVWVDPNKSGHIMYGNDGGLNISYNDGTDWYKCNTPAVGQFYHITTDNKEPYNVYGGLQDNGVWFGSSQSDVSTTWQETGHNAFKSIMGGDGMQVQVDTRDNATFYTGYQFGQYYRGKTTAEGRPKYITPKHVLGEKPLRFNWQSPILLSKHNQDVLYFGANKLYRSLNQGANFEAISPDLTNGGIKGNVPYGTITAIHESPMKFGVLYLGTDDGNVQFSPDGGVSWKNISAGLPKNLWISRIQASAFNKTTVYVALSGYRWDNFESYLYVSKNNGETWQRIGTDLPNAEPLNVVKEDPTNGNIIYVGTDHGAYVSINSGENFMPLGKGVPAVPVHDIVIQSTKNEIVLGTHGRSLYVGDATPIQKLAKSGLAKDLVVLNEPKLSFDDAWGKKRDTWSSIDTPLTHLVVYSQKGGTTKMSVRADKDIVLEEKIITLKPGINYIPYDLTYGAASKEKYLKHLNSNLKEGAEKIKDLELADNKKLYLHTGKYSVHFDKDGTSAQTILLIE